MKICEDHWTKLKKALEDRKILHRAAANGEKATEELRRQIDGTATPETYDPLMDCANMVYAQGLNAGGLYLLNGDYCPVCEALKHCPRDAEGPDGEIFADEEAIEKFWIDGPADAALQYCQENDLVWRENPDSEEDVS